MKDREICWSMRFQGVPQAASGLSNSSMGLKCSSVGELKELRVSTDAIKSAFFLYQSKALCDREPM